MTSDGISTEDWDVVKDLSARIANAVVGNDSRANAVLTRELFQYVATLEARYGSLPSILATKADYTDDLSLREKLLERGWHEAKKIGDKANLVFISSSLAALFINELCRVQAGKKWLSLLEEALESHWDDDEHEEYRRLSEDIQKLEANSQAREGS